MRRDTRQYFVVIGIYERWTSITVAVPRCKRCSIGHRIEQAVFWVLVGSAVVLGLMMLAGAASWAKPWELALVVLWVVAWWLLWLGVRRHWFRWRVLAPKPERYVRQHPTILELVEDGWDHPPIRP